VPTILLISLVGAFLSIGLVTGLIAYAIIEGRSPGRKQLQAAASASRVAAVVSPTPQGLAERPSPRMERVASFVPKSPSEMNRLRRRMVRAGYHSMTAAIVFSAAEVLTPAAIAVPLLAFVSWPTGLVLAAFGAVVGFLLPSLVLSRLIEKRRKAITNGLPDVLDLLIVCLEAGSSLDQAIVKATAELSLVHPALGEELKMLSTETRAGKPRIDAFKHLEARTRNDDIRSLVAMLVQTDRFGTSVSQALRTFAEVARTKRRQRAEERAAKVGVKMVFPLVLFLFPALYVATLGAAVVQIVRVFFGELVGG